MNRWILVVVINLVFAVFAWMAGYDFNARNVGVAIYFAISFVVSLIGFAIQTADVNRETANNQSSAE